MRICLPLLSLIFRALEKQISTGSISSPNYENPKIYGRYPRQGISEAGRGGIFLNIYPIPAEVPVSGGNNRT